MSASSLLPVVLEFWGASPRSGVRRSTSKGAGRQSVQAQSCSELLFSLEKSLLTHRGLGLHVWK